ncbi:MAG: TMEM43 family protein, partial [Vampirovibrionia bacterium]
MLKADLNNGSITETTKTGYFTRIKNAIIGVLIGIVLFIGSFVVLFMNEGRVNLSEIAKTATLITANEQAKSDLNNKLVALTGDLTTEEVIGDNLFLKPDKYLQLNRKVEMYSWDEDVDTQTKKNTGGSETTTKTYSYKKVWSMSPDNSSNFKESAGHFNPEKTIEDYSTKANKGKMGIYTVEVKDLNLPEAKKLTLSEEVLLKDEQSATKQIETTTTTETKPAETTTITESKPAETTDSDVKQITETPTKAVTDTSKP